jgi:hypothetical protein
MRILSMIHITQGHGNKPCSSWGPFWNLRHCGCWCTPPILVCTIVGKELCGSMWDSGIYHQLWQMCSETTFTSFIARTATESFWKLKRMWFHVHARIIFKYEEGGCRHGIETILLVDSDHSFICCEILVCSNWTNGVGKWRKDFLFLPT